jgi:hypothetical protein
LKRLIAAIALTALCALTFVTTNTAGAASSGPDVAFIDGLLLIPGLHRDVQRGTLQSGLIDVYVDGALVLEAVNYRDVDPMGTISPGTHNVQLCFHNGAAADPLPGSGCPFGSVNSNAGTDVTIPDTANVSLVGAFGGESSSAPGRPTVLAFVNDVSCVASASTARVSGAHAAAWSSDVKVLIDGTQTFGPLAAGESDSTDRASSVSTVAFQEASDNTPLAEEPALDLAAQVNTIVFLVGNPQNGASYDTIVQTIPLDICAVATTTTTTSPTSTTVAPVQVQPTFTG